MYDSRLNLGRTTEARFMSDHPGFEVYPCERVHPDIAHDDLPLGDSRRHHSDAWEPGRVIVNVKSDTDYPNIAMELMSVAALATVAHYERIEARIAVWFDDRWHYIDPAKVPMYCHDSRSGKGTNGSGTPFMLVAKDSDGWAVEMGT